jgi:hypothetical protein
MNSELLLFGRLNVLNLCEIDALHSLGIGKMSRTALMVVSALLSTRSFPLTEDVTMRHSSVNFQVFTALLDSSAPDKMFEPGQIRYFLLASRVKF